jgi:tRNA(Ile)-lysidine synthetase-like protein
LRNEWTPELDERLPGWQQNILRLRDWSLQTGQALEMIMKQLERGRNIWDWEQFCSLSEGLQKALIRYWIKKNHTSEFIVTHGILGEVTNICQMQSGQYISIGPEIQAWRDRNLLVFRSETESRPEKKVVCLKIDDLKAGPKVIAFVRFSLSNEYPRAYGKKLYCSLKASDWPITVRIWQDGDRFHPLGMKGHQLVSDFLTNRKIPSHRKKEALVVVSFDQKVCAVIFPPSSAVSLKHLGEGGPQQASSASGYPNRVIKRVDYGGQNSPLHREPGGVAESVRCPDNPVEVLTIEPIL